PSCRVTLPSCYRARTQLGDTTTNYQLQPGDRVYVATRTLGEGLAFWRARKTCDRCNGLQCPCPEPEYADFQSPISEYLPDGPAPVEFLGSGSAMGGVSDRLEPLPQPTRRGPLPPAVQPDSTVP